VCACVRVLFSFFLLSVLSSFFAAAAEWTDGDVVDYSATTTAVQLSILPL